MLNKHLIDFSTHLAFCSRTSEIPCLISNCKGFFLTQWKAHTCQTPVSGILVSSAHFNLLWATEQQEVQVFYRAGGNFSQVWWGTPAGLCSINVGLVLTPKTTAGLKFSHLVLEIQEESCGRVSHIHPRVIATRTGNSRVTTQSSSCWTLLGFRGTPLGRSLTISYTSKHISTKLSQNATKAT